MQPSKTTITGLFNSPYQYQIPIFQRGYVWTLEKQVVPLWADIQERVDARLERDAAQQSVGAGVLKPLQKHFLGSLVMTPGGAVGERGITSECLPSRRPVLQESRDLWSGPRAPGGLHFGASKSRPCESARAA